MPTSTQPPEVARVAREAIDAVETTLCSGRRAVWMRWVKLCRAVISAALRRPSPTPPRRGPRDGRGRDGSRFRPGTSASSSRVLRARRAHGDAVGLAEQPTVSRERRTVVPPRDGVFGDVVEDEGDHEDQSLPGDGVENRHGRGTLGTGTGAGALGIVLRSTMADAASTTRRATRASRSDPRRGRRRRRRRSRPFRYLREKKFVQRETILFTMDIARRLAELATPLESSSPSSTPLRSL